MTEHPYENETSQRERKAVLKNDTFLSRAMADDELGLGGRFKRLSNATIVGATPGPQVPTLPEGSPWSNDPVGDERPLGFEIDAMEPVGTEAEITRSIAGTPLTAPTESSPAVETGGVPAPRRRA